MGPLSNKSPLTHKGPDDVCCASEDGKCVSETRGCEPSCPSFPTPPGDVAKVDTVQSVGSTATANSTTDLGSQESSTSNSLKKSLLFSLFSCCSSSVLKGVVPPVALPPQLLNLESVIIENVVDAVEDAADVAKAAIDSVVAQIEAAAGVPPTPLKSATAPVASKVADSSSQAAKAVVQYVLPPSP